MPIVDLLLNNTFIIITIIVSVIGFFVFGGLIANLYENKSADLTTNDRLLFFLYFSGLLLCLCTFIAFLFFLKPQSHVYQLLRQQLAPPTWETFQIAESFNRGYHRFDWWTFGFALVVILPIAIMLVPIFIFLADFSGFIETSIAIGAIVILVMYGITFFGNCSFFWVNQQFQYILFGQSGPPIAFSLELEKRYGNKCGAITTDDIEDIQHHFFTTTPVYEPLHLKDGLERLKNDPQLKRLFSKGPSWISPLADYLGIYMVIYALVAGLLKMVKTSIQ